MPLTHLPGIIFSAETPYTDAQYDQAKEKVRYPHDHAVLVFNDQLAEFFWSTQIGIGH
jgi:hypothetical protein